MTALDEFYEAYLHYSVSQRLFEDRCRQLTECNGTVAERQALVDETLRLAMCVTNNVIDLEPLLSEAADELRNDGGDRDILKALSLISNSIREDRDRADSYTLFVTARRSGNTVRRPRKPRVANPFVYVEEESEDEEEEVVTPAPAHVPAREKPKPAPVIVPEEPVEEEESGDEEKIPEDEEEEDTAEDVTEDVTEDAEEVAEEEESAEGGETGEESEEQTEEEDPEDEETEEETPVVAPARPKPRPAPVVVHEDPAEEETGEAPPHSAALDRPRPKRRAKPRTEEPPEEDFVEVEEPEAPKQGVGSWFRNVGSSLISHILRRK